MKKMAASKMNPWFAFMNPVVMDPFFFAEGSNKQRVF
jgi:hypothetical protein